MSRARRRGSEHPLHCRSSTTSPQPPSERTRLSTGNLPLTGAGHLNLESKTTNAITTNAKNGVKKAGLGLAPVIAITVSNVDTEAVLETGSPLTVESVLATATQIAGVSTRATGDVSGATDSAVGVALAFTCGRPQRDGHDASERDCHRSVQSSSRPRDRPTTNSSASASASGATSAGRIERTLMTPSDGPGGGPGAVRRRPGRGERRSHDRNGTPTPSATSISPATSPSRPRLPINLTNTTALAEIPVGVTVTALLGPVWVKTTANTDASTASADGSAASPSGSAVGVGVSTPCLPTS